MKTISDKDYEEYLTLKKWDEKQKIRESVTRISKLEDDIDAPIKKCVACLALLGCEPLYSCCGFDYEGQPYHKSHQYGRPYIVLTVKPLTLQILQELSSRKTFWQAGRGNYAKWTNLELICGMNPHWRRDECIHFYEESLVGIIQLQNLLMSAYPKMLDEITLVDTNFKAKIQSKHWQYPPKESWHIQKSLLDSY